MDQLIAQPDMEDFSSLLDLNQPDSYTEIDQMTNVENDLALRSDLMMDQQEEIEGGQLKDPNEDLMSTTSNASSGCVQTSSASSFYISFLLFCLILSIWRFRLVSNSNPSLN